MSKRERIEDLGVLKEKLKNLFNHELFDIFEKYDIRRPKDVCEIFSEIEEDKKLELVSSLAYMIEEVRDLIADCLDVAEGEDITSF